jgi:hypothetical protein
VICKARHFSLLSRGLQFDLDFKLQAALDYCHLIQSQMKGLIQKTEGE